MSVALALVSLAACRVQTASVQATPNSTSSTSTPLPAPPSTHPGLGRGELPGDGIAAGLPATLGKAAFDPDGRASAGSIFANLSEDHALDGKGPVVALTFDDGPSPYTARIVEILERFGATATFFQITNQDGSRSELVKSMAVAGFRIGTHTRSHAHLPKLAAPAQADEIAGSADYLDGLIGAGSVRCLRPPYGEADLNTIAIAGGRGLAIATWSVDTDDWQKPGWPAIVNRAVLGAHDRSVILMHDGGGDRTQTIEALPWVLQALKDKGFGFVSAC